MFISVRTMIIILLSLIITIIIRTIIIIIIIRITSMMLLGEVLPENAESESSSCPLSPRLAIVEMFRKMAAL